MTSRPRLATEKLNPVQGLAAVALFIVLAVVFVMAQFGPSTGFSPDASITASIGYALFNLAGADIASEGMLAAFEIIDVVLVAALVGAVLLARRETREAATDGGQDVGKGGDN